MKSVHFILLSTLACCPFALTTPLHQRQTGKQMVYGFGELQATADLSWTSCFDTFTCAKLQVPLDYENEAAGTTHVSFIKWTANSNSTRANSTVQNILFNPGGPGVSGINTVLLGLSELQGIFGTANNIVGFDPRGVNNSGPSLSCFPDGTSSAYSEFAIPLDANQTKSYGEAYARAAAFGNFCTQAHSAPNDTAKYANTVATANDMRYYTELLAKSKGQDAQKSQLWYYGVSYGSALGTAFASLFPDRVGRIVVDGIVDGEDYFQGKWASNLPDADKAFRSFFQTCYDAGKNGTCSFWANSPEAIEARFDAVIADLTLHPIPVVTDTPTIATISDFKRIMALAVYTPLELFPILADMLVELESRDASFLATLLGLGQRSSECAPLLNQPATYEPSQFIACTDANGRFNLSTYDAWVEYADDLIQQSNFLGEVWAAGRSVHCRKLDIKAPKSQVFEGYPSADRTSNPLLFLSTAIDPVTPLRSAEKMVKRFGGAALLVQDSVGHSTTSASSKCTFKVVETYFKTGQVPHSGTRCEADKVPFRDEAGVGNSTRPGLLRRRSFFHL